MFRKYKNRIIENLDNYWEFALLWAWAKKGLETRISCISYFTIPIQSSSAIYACTLNNKGSLEGTLQYYYHATPGEPYEGSPEVA